MKRNVSENAKQKGKRNSVTHGKDGIKWTAKACQRIATPQTFKCE